MEYPYAVYDALIGIDVPAEKARAVVDAMERDMGTTLATRQDLLMLEQKLEERISAVEQSVAHLKVSVEKDMALLSSTLTVRLGSMLGSMFFVGMGLLFAALKLT